ncbi:glycosyltransferase family 61 protein [Phreatobacter aquaticus]|uniref:Glycosyltransferase family 61 protein n=1 Tax=Phreatobacter aquaticus TaxID=2570229 RepID=A0A4D7QQE5_9HYPH|nr:glycosyltransferase family 61 protein [Phreatobacter aquaticus]QCK88203.1 glycosyltransferase family 61 protein [Phreatobacter aquaticus]
MSSAALAHPPLRHAEEFLSCAPDGLYEGGGYYDSEVPLALLRATHQRHGQSIRTIARLAPALQAERPMPTFLGGPDAGFLDNLTAHYADLNRSHRQLAPTLLVEIDNAVIFRNQIMALRDGALVPIYEINRPNERYYRTADSQSVRDTALPPMIVHGAGNHLFSGSIGSFNYGHWLIDDFCALAALQEVERGEGPARVVMTATTPAIDTIRREGLDAASGRKAPLEPLFLHSGAAHLFPKLRYITPITYHPVLKHPDWLAAGVALCRQAFDEGAIDRTLRRKLRQIALAAHALGYRLLEPDDPARSPRLFVNRGAGYRRQLTNADEIRPLLQAFGYREVLPETMTLRRQWATFSRATHVVGIMGAAMSNVLFAGPDVRVLHLAPGGWYEPFYWDLASMRGLPYAALYGTPEADHGPDHLRSFAVDKAALAGWLEATHGRAG